MTGNMVFDATRPVDDRYSPPPLGELEELAAALAEGRLSGGAPDLPHYEAELAGWSPRRGQQCFLRPPRNPATTNRPGSQNGILTIDKGRFIVRLARLAPAMISTPGHRASRRRQRGALPAWSSTDSYWARCLHA